MTNLADLILDLQAELHSHGNGAFELETLTYTLPCEFCKHSYDTPSTWCKENCSHYR